MGAVPGNGVAPAGDIAPCLAALPGIAAAFADPARYFVITGGGGWLGRAALDILDSIYGANLLCRLAVFGASTKTLQLRSGRLIASRPFAEMQELRMPAPIILHFAYLTRGYAAQMSLGDYQAINRNLSVSVVTLTERCGAAGVFVPSSGAVYRRDRTLENDVEANPYGMLKLEDEERFGNLAHRRGVPTFIARIFNLSGPFMNHVSHYALGSILQDITSGRPITIKADHAVVRSYAHVGDVLSLALALLLRGQSAGPLDIAGEPAIEIGALARRAALLLGRPELAINRPPYETGQPDIYVGDGAQFASLSGAGGLNVRSLDEQIIDTAAFLQDAV
jgi:nucleoside-diphosphate-sugar epimerase